MVVAVLQAACRQHSSGRPLCTPPLYTSEATLSRMRQMCPTIAMLLASASHGPRNGCRPRGRRLQLCTLRPPSSPASCSMASWAPRRGESHSSRNVQYSFLMAISGRFPTVAPASPRIAEFARFAALPRFRTRDPDAGDCAGERCCSYPQSRTAQWPQPYPSRPRRSRPAVLCRSVQKSGRQVAAAVSPTAPCRCSRVAPPLTARGILSGPAPGARALIRRAKP